MNKKLPRVYVKKQEKIIGNNLELFYSKEKTENLDIQSEKINELIINKKINDIFNSPKYIYKITTFIKTNEWEGEKVIIAKTNNSLLTLDNEIIKIKDIKDITIL